jgi:hypothetical protein
VFGGQGSNYTKSRVLEESVLIELYRSCHTNIERNFGLASLTSRHAPPDLTKTFEKMASYFEAHSPNQYKTGRKTAYTIPDMLNKGQGLIYNMIPDVVEAGESEEPHGFTVEGEDLSL